MDAWVCNSPERGSNAYHLAGLSLVARGFGVTKPRSTSDEGVAVLQTRIPRRTSIAATALILGYLAFKHGPHKQNSLVRIEPAEADLRRVMAVESFGAIGDGITDDTAAFLRALVAGQVISNGTYRVSGLELTSSAPVNLSGHGMLKTMVPGHPVLLINAQGQHMRGGRIEGLRLRQPNLSALAAGMANNHACLKVQGVEGFVARNLDMSGADIAASFHFGAANLPYRANRNIVGESFHATNLRGMGLELFGCQGGSFTGHYFTGSDGAGGRAMFHGVRFAAYKFAPNKALQVSLTAINFLTGASFQRYTSGVTCRLTAVNCTNGVQMHGSSEGVKAAELCRDNHIIIEAEDCDFAVYDGGSNNRYTIHAQRCRNGIRSVAGDDGVGENTLYEGRIEAGRGRLAWISQRRAGLDLILRGSNPSEAAFGLLLDGDEAQGQVSVANCKSGVRITGNRNNIRAEVKSCPTAMVITGHNNTISADVDGDLIVSGNNNNVTGLVTGSASNRGSGNVIRVA